MALQVDWTVLLASAGACYTAGSVVNRIMNGKHVSKEVCEEKEKAVQGQLTALKEDVVYIRDSLDEMRGIPKKKC
jgi:hypothetical protein